MSVPWVTSLAFDMSAILLGHMKLPTEEVKRAILSCDEGVLIEPHLRQMEAFAPSKSEVCRHCTVLANCLHICLHMYILYIYICTYCTSTCVHIVHLHVYILYIYICTYCTSTYVHTVHLHVYILYIYICTYCTCTYCTSTYVYCCFDGTLWVAASGSCGICECMYFTP